MQKRGSLFLTISLVISILFLSVAGISAQEIGAQILTADSCYYTGFETDSDGNGVPDGIEFSKGNVSLTSSIKFRGEQSVVFESTRTKSNNPRFVTSDYILINPAENYELKGFVKSLNGKEIVFLGLEYYDSNKEPVHFKYDNGTKTIHYYSYPAISNKNVSTKWTLYRGNITGESETGSNYKFPIGTKYVKVVGYGAYTAGEVSTPGKVWMDEIQFCKLSSNNRSGSGGGSSQTMREACSELSNDARKQIKNLIDSGENIILKEGVPAKAGDVIVLGGRMDLIHKTVSVEGITVSNQEAKVKLVPTNSQAENIEENIILVNANGVFSRKNVTLFGTSGFEILVNPTNQSVSINWAPYNKLDLFNCPEFQEVANSCPDLVQSIKNPQAKDNFELIGSYSYRGSTSAGYDYENSEWIKLNYTAYSATWKLKNSESQKTGSYLDYQVIVYDNQSVDIGEIISLENYWNLCSTHQIYDIQNNLQNVYVCSWNPSGEQDSLKYQETQKNKIVIWNNKNVIIRVYVGDYKRLSNEETLELFMELNEEFMQSLEDNNEEWARGTNIYDLDTDRRLDLANALLQCKSEVKEKLNDEGIACTQEWVCKTEPVICPEYGYQTQICEDKYCTGEVKESTRSCSPGICSGCYTQRWWGSNSRLDNICIPYGTRLGDDKTETEEIYEFSEIDSQGNVGINLSIINEKQVYLFIDDDGIVFDQIMNLGLSYELNDGGRVVKIIVDTIVPKTSNSKGYVVITMIATFSSYCDVDGNIKQQKDKQYNGEWAKCQNNYECSSNFCSSGECIEIQSLINEGSRLKSFFTRVACRLVNPFDNSGYNSCIADNLGLSPQMSPPLNEELYVTNADFEYTEFDENMIASP